MGTQNMRQQWETARIARADAWDRWEADPTAENRNNPARADKTERQRWRWLAWYEALDHVSPQILSRP